MERKVPVAERSMCGLLMVALVAGMAILGLTGLVPGAEAAVAPLQNWPATPQFTATTGNLSGTFTVSPGSNRLMVVAVQIYNGASVAQTVSGTYGGRALQQATLQATAQFRSTWIGYLRESDIAAASGTTLSVTIAGAHTYAYAYIATYEGVDQSAPITDSNSAYYNQAAVSFGKSVAVNAGGYGVYTWMNDNRTRTSDTESYTENADAATAGAYTGIASKAITSTGTTNPTVTFSALPRCSISAVALNPVSDTTPPTAGTVTVTPQSGSYVPSDFSISTTFTDNETAVTSCEYTTSGSTWAAATVSGSGPYTCTASVTGASGSLTINMRATSVGGTGTATALNRAVDAAAPTTTAAPAGGTYTADQSVSLSVVDGTGSGVQGTVYCVDTANTCSPATSYASAVAVTGTPGLSVTKYLRYRSTDNVGNIEAVKSSQYIIDLTCSDPTPSTITIPAGQTVSGTVDLTTLYTFTSGANLGSFTYKINGISRTTPWDSSALGTSGSESVTFQVTGTDTDCNTLISASSTISVNNFNGITSGTATAAGKDRSILVTAPYEGDINNNATISIFYAVCAGGDCSAATKPGTPVVTATAPDTPYSYTITGLTNGATYKVWVDYADSDGGSASQAIADVIPINPLMHNSLTTGSTKWLVAQSAESVDGWGIAGAKYGEFTCATCHVKNATPNIKRLRPAINAPDPVTSDFPGSGETVRLTTTDQNANPAEVGFGDDTGGRINSNKVCEVCHSITKYHRYNPTADPDGPGPLTAQADLTHYNKQDCVSCHQHKLGFKASCDACHGNPPVGAATLVFTPAATGSAEAGAHAGHVVDEAGPQYSCEVCHGNPFGTGANHTTDGSGKVTIDFNAFGTTGASVAGTYNGQASVVAGVGYDGGNAGAAGSLTCSSTYCHGGTIGGNTPKWNDPSAPCGSCHGATASAPPASPASSFSHQSHAGTGGKVDAQNSTALTGTALACSACHGANGAGAVGHLDGKTQFNVGSLASDYRNPATPVKYKTLQSGDSGGLARVNPYSTCTNLACHWGTTTPAWNAGAATCTTCHNNGNNSGLLADAAPASGKHADHVTASATYVTCNNCHGTGANTGAHAGHIDGTVNFYGTVSAADNNLDATDFVGEATRGVTTDDYCAAVCHKDGDWGNGSVATTASVAANRGTIDWTVDCSSVPVVDFCLDCHSDAYSAKAGPTVVTRWLDNGAAGLPTGSHLKATTAETLPGEDTSCTSNDVVAWKTQCQKCHTKHSGTVAIPLPPTSWDNPGTATVETTDMRAQLGISYAGADHGAIKLGGTSTSGSTEADLCWNCHDISETINEWGYNQDTNGATFPATTIADRNAVSQGSHNYGYIYTTSARTTKAKGWVDASGNGYWHQDGYSTATQLQRQIKSVHSVNFTPANQKSSVGTTVNATTGVVTHVAQETPANIRCSYCHDVHDLNLAVSDTNTGRPFLRGSWMGNPYPPDMPPLTGYTYPSTGGAKNVGNRQTWSGGTFNAADATPRLYVSTSKNKGGYFLDQNSNWPTKDASYDTLAETAGVCTICHGADVDNMDFYPNSAPATNMWRTDQVNGHANSALGGTGASHANARNIFDGKRGATNYIFMGFQDEITPTLVSSWGKNSLDGITPQSTAPYAQFSQPGDSGAGSTNMPAYLTGWFGGTEGAKFASAAARDSAVPQYTKWYNGSTTPTATAAIGTDGSAGATRAHSFTCSKCHTPHSSSLPALLITNCLDNTIATWTGGSDTAIRANPTNTFVKRTQNTCHRKEGTTTGWHRLSTGQ